MKNNGILPDEIYDIGSEAEFSREELEIISVQGGKSVIRLELDSGRAVRYLADGSTVPVRGKFPQSLIDAGKICEESVDDLIVLCESAKRREHSGNCGVWLNAPDGRRRWCVTEYSLLPNPEGGPTHAIISMRDETELRERELAYEKWRESLLSMFAENASYAEFNLTKGVMERQMGMAPGSAGEKGNCSLDDFVDYGCDYLIFEDDRDAYREFFDSQRLLALFERNVTEDTLEYRDCQDGVHWTRANVQMSRYPGSDDIKAFIVYTNIDRQRSELERLARLASRDSLTNILNRKALEDRISERLRTAGKNDLSALYIIDLDNFKQINDRFGHQAGDETLKNVAAALNNTFRSGDIVGRLGGDEFMAFISDVTERNAITRANRLLNELQFYVERTPVSASIGLALCRGSAEFSELYRSADMALYKSKDMGKNRCTVYRHGDEESLISEEIDELRKSGMIQLQTLLEYMDGGVIIVEVNGDSVNEVYVSPSYYSTVRRAPGKPQNQGSDLFDAIVEEFKPEVMSALVKTTQTGEPTDTIYQVMAANGTEWHHLRAARLPGSEESPRVIGVVTDVSELKRSSSQLEAIANYSTVGIAMFEPSESGARATFVNPKLQSMIGLTMEQINQQPKVISRLTGKRMLGDAVPAKRITPVEESTFEFVCRGRDISPQSQTQYIQARGVHIYQLAAGTAVLVMYSDISRERAMEEELRIAEERYRIAAAQTGMIIWEVDIAARTTRQLSAQPNAVMAEENVFSDSPESMLTSGHIHSDSEQVLRAMYSDIYAGRESDEYVLRRRDSNGEYVWARSRYTLVRGADGRVRHAVGVSEVMPNIDSELRELRRTWQFSGLIEDLQLATVHINLTRDQVDYVHANGAISEEWADMRTFADCKERLRSIMADCEENNELIESITAEWLTNLYRDGRSTYMFEFRTADEKGWNNLFLDLMRDPLSGDIWVFVYLRDISNKRVTESLLKETATYDTVTQMYSYATVRAAIDAVVEKTDPSDRMVMSVLELVGLDMLMSEQGVSEANRVLNIVGRLFRLLVGDTAIFGHLTQNRFIVMYADVQSAEYWRDAMQQVLERANDLLHRSDVSQSVYFVCGYIPFAAEKADCGALIRKASIACRAAVGAGLSFAEYSEVELGNQPDDVDTVEVDKDISPETAELTRKYHALEVRYQQLANQQLASDYDQVTGLYNQSTFMRVIQEHLSDNAEGYAVVACAIENLDAYCRFGGAQAGDRLIGVLAEEMKKRRMIVARNGSSGLMALVRMENFDEEEMHSALQLKLAGQTAAFDLNVSMGIYHVGDGETSAVRMCEYARTAQNIAGSGRWEVYDPALHDTSVENRELLRELTRAIAEKQLQVYFMPQIDCRSGCLAGASAMLLWEHPAQGRLYPENFVPLFRHNGMAGQLGEYVADQCCRLVKMLEEKNGTSVPVCISEREAGVGMYIPGFERILERTAERHGIDRQMIVLEVRENAYLENPAHLMSVVGKLHESGFRVGIEGFGRGRSSANIVAELPIDGIRLDSDYTKRCMESRRGKCVLSALLNMLRQMEMPVVATGVDDPDVAAELKALGGYIMQGSRVAKAVTGSKLLDYGIYRGNKDASEVSHWSDSVEQEQLLSNYSEAMMACFNEICELDFDQGTITVRYSSYGHRLLGVARPLHETVERLCAAHVVPGDREKLREFIDNASRMSAGEHLAIEYDLRGNDGRQYTIYSRVAPINSTRCLLCNTDISGRKLLASQNEKDWIRSELRRERQNYYSMVERLGSTIVEWDLTDGTCWSSDSCAKYALSGRSGGIVGSGVHSEDMVSFALFMSKLERGENYTDTTLRMKMTDGSYRWTRLNGEAVRDDSGIPVRMLVSLTDVDDDMRNRQEIADYTARSVAFIENIPSGVLIANINKDTITGSANECFSSMIGYTSDQLARTIHKHWTDIVAPGDRKWIASEIRRLVSGEQKQVDVVCSLRHREGFDVTVRVLAALIDQDNVSTSIAFICVDEQVDTE